MGIEEPTTWESYEDVARYLLEKLGDVLGLGLESVEGKQKLVGESGAEWEIDGKGVKADGGAIVVVECRRYTTSRVKQGAVAQLAWTINDLGAAGGIVVTPIGVQRGGQLIAKAAGIQIVHLDADSTTTGYLLRFLGNVVVGPGGATLGLTGGVPIVTIAPAEPNE
jgi:Restriction endonuclease